MPRKNWFDLSVQQAPIDEEPVNSEEVKQQPITPSRARSRSIDVIVQPRSPSQQTVVPSASAAPAAKKRPALAINTSKSSEAHTPVKQQQKEDVDVHTPVYLRHQYSLYYDEGVRAAPNTTYLDTLLNTRLGDFDTVQAFWAYINTFESVLQQKEYFNLRLFKKHVHPIWEHASNKQGGKWTITIQNRKERQAVWQELAMAFIGGEHFRDDSVTGIILSARPRFDSIQLWVNRKSSLSREKILSIFTQSNSQNWNVEFQMHSPDLQTPSTPASPVAKKLDFGSEAAKPVAAVQQTHYVLNEVALVREKSRLVIRYLTIAFSCAIVLLIALIISHQFVIKL